MKEESRILEKLIPLSLQLFELAPWKWMYEFEVFGVEPPGSDVPYFGSIMGSASEFAAVSFYEGSHSADQFLFIQEAEIGSVPDDVLLIPHLMVSLEPSGHMQPDDRKRIKNLGYSLSGKNDGRLSINMYRGIRLFFPNCKSFAICCRFWSRPCTFPSVREWKIWFL